jgi:nitrate/TMAO reductase-like tetraheme cytochrome c subunit
VSSAEEGKDSCVECHSSPSFLVTNKKLYDYFQRWLPSIHSQEGVTCVDCHGGNPRSSSKEAAHRGDPEASRADSAVNFRNVPHTCGGCHEDVYRGFRESSHFEHLSSEDQEDQGPTCVTCHGSINVAVLNVATVEEVCRQCHNERNQNSPENSHEARALLNRFLSIHRYYRYIAVRGDPVETREFFEKVDAAIRELSVTWHTFDLPEIKEMTETILDAVKQKRGEVARVYKMKRQEREEQRKASAAKE